MKKIILLFTLLLSYVGCSFSDEQKSISPEEYKERSGELWIRYFNSEIVNAEEAVLEIKKLLSCVKHKDDSHIDEFIEYEQMLIYLRLYRVYRNIPDFDEAGIAADRAVHFARKVVVNDPIKSVLESEDKDQALEMLISEVDSYQVPVWAHQF